MTQLRQLCCKCKFKLASLFHPTRSCISISLAICQNKIFVQSVKSQISQMSTRVKWTFLGISSQVCVICFGKRWHILPFVTYLFAETFSKCGSVKPISLIGMFWLFDSRAFNFLTDEKMAMLVLWPVCCYMGCCYIVKTSHKKNLFKRKSFFVLSLLEDIYFFYNLKIYTIIWVFRFFFVFFCLSKMRFWSAIINIISR